MVTFQTGIALTWTHQFVCQVGRGCKSMVYGKFYNLTAGSEQGRIYPILMHHIGDVPSLS